MYGSLRSHMGARFGYILGLVRSCAPADVTQSVNATENLCDEAVSDSIPSRRPPGR